MGGGWRPGAFNSTYPSLRGGLDAISNMLDKFQCSRTVEVPSVHLYQELNVLVILQRQFRASL